MTVVVTGASGHIGANLIRQLLRRGDHVRALVHRNTAPLDGLDVEIVHGDVLDAASLRAAFEGADVVYHLAALISIAGDPRGTVRAVNVDGAENVARTALDTGVRRLVHCSSVHAFDLRPTVRPLDETSPRTPDDPRRHAAYDRSKAEGERRVRAVIAQGLDAVVAHPTGVIGPYDFEPSRMGRFLLRLHQRKLPALVQGGFDFVDVRDVSQGLIAAAADGRSGESYLLSGHYLRVPELAATAQAITGVRPPRLTVPMWTARLGAPFVRLATILTGGDSLFTTESLAAVRANPNIDNAKARRDLGYAPRPTSETIRDTYRWFADAGRIPPDSTMSGTQ